MIGLRRSVLQHCHLFAITAIFDPVHKAIRKIGAMLPMQTPFDKSPSSGKESPSFHRGSVQIRE